MSVFSYILRSERKKKGITQQELSENLNISRETLIKWEKGIGSPNIDQLDFICQIFDCDPGYLLGYHSARRAVSSLVSESLGISENAVDVLVSLRKNGNPVLTLISSIIENAISEDPEQTDSNHVDILGHISWLINMDLGPGCAAHEAHFYDPIDKKNTMLYVSPKQIYDSSMMDFYNTLCNYIGSERRKCGRPNYD